MEKVFGGGGKPGAVISSSPGAGGAFGGAQILRQSFVFLDILCMQQPEAYIGNVAALFTDTGEISKPDTRDFLQKYIDAFALWVEKIT